MRKILTTIILLFCAIDMTCSSAIATQQIFYNSAGTGVPSQMMDGYGNMQNLNDFGYNAPYVVTRPVRPVYPIARYARPVHPVRCCARPRPPYPPNITHRDIIMARTYYRRCPMYQQYYTVKTPPKQKEIISRFDKNYKIPQSSQRKVSCGGMTYYNSANPCR